MTHFKMSERFGRFVDKYLTSQNPPEWVDYAIDDYLQLIVSWHHNR
ncbi:MAG: hypothetical protein KAS32_10990 [Candidatus Peribacteraceae bacterium]|nr:hypothetical protein [Candidatus Peribacteraceae bacterium]